VFEQIGKLKMELEWLEKNSSLLNEVKRSLIDGSDPELSVSEPCRLPNLARSSYYHAKVGESGEDLVLKRHLNRLYTDSRLLGYGRWLWNWPTWASECAERGAAG